MCTLNKQTSSFSYLPQYEYKTHYKLNETKKCLKIKLKQKKSRNTAIFLFKPFVAK